MSVSDAPALAGIHHLKLPVTDLARSREWYRSRLGYQVQVEFVEQGQLMGYALSNPKGARLWACGSIRNAPGQPQDSTTSPSACPTGRRSTNWPPG
jgi:catechol 2,3-dioxygenase-like lactoylglutathione lyase family enzyme